MTTTFGDSRLPERFWSKVEQASNGCWEWTRARSWDGYGAFHFARRDHSAHRFAYMALVGPISDGLQLDHLCHTNDKSCPGGGSCPHRRCVNPAHLEPVTSHENTMRGESFSAENAAKTHCPQGHAFDEANTYLHCGRRCCRACRRDRSRNQKRIARAAASNV